MTGTVPGSTTGQDAPPAPGWVRRLGAYLGRHRADVAIAAASALLLAACQVTTPLIARQVVDQVTASKGQPLWPWIVLLVVLACATFVFARQRRYRGGRLALTVQNDLRNDMHDSLQRLDAAALDSMSTGQLVARSNSDTALAQGLLNFLPMVAGNVLMMLLSLVVMFVLSPLLAVVGLLVMPALLYVSYRMRRHVFPASWDGQQKEGEVAGIVDEDIAGVRVVKAFGQERRELNRLTAAATRLFGAQMRTVRIQSRYQPILEAIPALGQVGVLALGGWLALNGQITLGTFLAFSSYIGQLMAPARQLAGMLTIAQQARAGVERIFQVIDLVPRVQDAPGAVELEAEPGAIEFDDVVFGYGDGAPVLDGFSLTVRPGERVAIVGTSGSGKSTVARLLERYYDVRSGAISIGGRDLRELTLASLRGGIGVAFEDAFLFSDSVRENIAYGAPADGPPVTEEQIVAAARAAHADGFVRELPRGYDTVVGERGLSLSGGQRQRIALARALLRDPRILVLDDATSAIDARTEQGIHDALREAMAGRTVLLIAHRQSTLRLADRIVVLDGGRVVDEGTHEQLLERSAVYRALFGATDAERRGDVDALAAASTAGMEGSTAHRSTARAPRFALGGAPGLGMGLGGGGGRGRGMRGALAPTPELLARVAALPPVKDVPDVDLAVESRRIRDFSLRSLLREFRKPLAIALIFVVLDAIAGLLGPAVVKTGIDQGVTTGAVAVVFGASGLYLLITIADMITGIGESFVTGRTAQRIMLSLRIRVFAQLQRLSLDYYEREMAGRIMTRMTTDVDQFESLLQNGLLGALVALVTFVGVGVAIVLVNVELGLAVLTVIVPLAIATVMFRRRASVLYDQSRERIAIVNSAFQEGLSGVREAQAFTHEAATIERFHGLGASYLESRVAAQRLVATYFPFVQFLSAIADAIVLGLGAVLIVEGHLTAGALIAFLLYVDMFFSPIQQLSQVFDAWQQTVVSVARISDLMKLDTLTPESPDARPVGRLEGRVEAERVHFAYPTGPVAGVGVGVRARGPQDPRGMSRDAGTRAPIEALAGVELRIRAGETVALVGETGAGKSTVMKLIARFYDPDTGEVLADGADLRGMRLEDFRANLGYVPQESFLFTGTIADNIAYGRPDAPLAEIEEAARAVGADEMIRALPDGYETEISERGGSLSSGQRQLLALARAQLVDPAILLLDEATSNLDLATEARVTSAMERLARHRTTVLIAHRLQTAMTADRIVLLARGRVEETGTHAELLERDGAYAAMWRAFELATTPG